MRPYRGPDRPLHILHLALALIRIAGPKESPKSIFLPPRHDMHMQVRHTLADPIVNCDQRPFSFHGCLHGPRQQLCRAEKWRDQIRRQIAERLVMLSWNQQGMPREKRPVIEERQRHRILIDDASGMSLRNNGAKEARHGYQLVIDPSGRKYVCARFATGCVISAICVNCFMSSSTPRPGRSFAYSFPFLKSRHTGKWGRVRP